MGKLRILAVFVVAALAAACAGRQLMPYAEIVEDESGTVVAQPRLGRGKCKVIPLPADAPPPLFVGDDVKAAIEKPLHDEIERLRSVVPPIDRHSRDMIRFEILEDVGMLRQALILCSKRQRKMWDIIQRQQKELDDRKPEEILK